MKIRVLHNLNYVDTGGVIHELHKGDEAEINPADIAKCGSMVELPEPVTEAFDKPVVDKMVRNAHHK